MAIGWLCDTVPAGDEPLMECTRHELSHDLIEARDLAQLAISVLALLKRHAVRGGVQGSDPDALYVACRVTLTDAQAALFDTIEARS